MNYHVIIPAAGQGKRMQAGVNKQFLLLNDKPVLIHTVQLFQSDEDCLSITVVANHAEIDDIKKLFSTYKLSKVLNVIAGGAERQHSVYNGVKSLQVDDEAIVFVHDGARPFVSKDLLRPLAQKAANTGAAVLAVRVKDTIKKVDNEKVVETVDRSSLWAIQTPQAFRLSVLRQAHEAAISHEYIGTDDASLVERFGHEVMVVEGEYTNIKLTTPEDMLFAKVIVDEREKRND